MRFAHITRGVTGPGHAGSRNIRVSDAPSLGSEPCEVGLAAGGGALAIWSHRIDTQNYLFDVYGSRIASGVSCSRAR